MCAPAVAGPTECLPREEHLRAWAEANMPAARREQFLTPGFIEIRPVELLPPLQPYLSNRESAREHGWGRSTPTVFSRGGSLLPSIYADARAILMPSLFQRPCGVVPTPVQPEAGPAELTAWIRAQDNGGGAANFENATNGEGEGEGEGEGGVGDSAFNHALMLAYASDFVLLTTALRPHGVGLFDPKLEIATLTHAIHFHRPCRLDEWNLHAMSSPTASDTLGFTTGSVFAGDGALVASTVQEGLMRMRARPPRRRPTILAEKGGGGLAGP